MVQMRDGRREAETKAAAGLRPALLEAHEALQNPSAIRGLYPDPVVGHFDDEIVGLAR